MKYLFLFALSFVLLATLAFISLTSAVLVDLKESANRKWGSRHRGL